MMLRWVTILLLLSAAFVTSADDTEEDPKSLEAERSTDGELDDSDGSGSGVGSNARLPVVSSASEKIRPAQEILITGGVIAILCTVTHIGFWF